METTAGFRLGCFFKVSGPPHLITNVRPLSITKRMNPLEALGERTRIISRMSFVLASIAILNVFSALGLLWCAYLYHRNWAAAGVRMSQAQADGLLRIWNYRALPWIVLLMLVSAAACLWRIRKPKTDETTVA